MNIGIDGNEANIKRRVGVGQYAFNLLSELSLQKTSHRYFIYLKSKPISDMPPETDHWRYIVFGPHKMWTRFALPIHLYLFSPKLDLFYSPSHYSPSFCPCPTIPTIHDLGYLTTKEQFTKKDIFQLVHWTEWSIDKAYKIVAVSKFTKNEINKIYGIDKSKIEIVYNGICSIPTINSHLSKTIINKFNISKPYFLYLGTLKPNKNINFLIESFSKLNDNNLQLVIAGKKGWLFDNIFALVKEKNLTNSVIFTDYITEEEKWALYKNAIASVLPSLYEGFGIPAIESQICLTPVIVSKIPAFIEILKPNSALFIDPNRTDELVSALKQVMVPKIKQNLIKNGQKNSELYSWTNSAKALLNVFNKI